MSAAAAVEAMSATAGGWWRSRPAEGLLSLYTASDDTYYRAHHEYVTHEGPDSFAASRAGYVLGHLAGLNPELLGHHWSDVETQLREAWNSGTGVPWAVVSQFAEAAFRRSSAAREDAWRARLAESDEAWNAA